MKHQRKSTLLLMFCLLIYCLLFGNGLLDAQTLKGKSDVDWPMFGGSLNRNNFHPVKDVHFDFEFPTIAKDRIADPGKKLLWTQPTGTQSYGSVVVSGGKVYIGSNNGSNYRPGIHGDRGVLLCFDEETGEFLWQLTRDKLETGRINDWPLQGIVSTPCVDGDRLYIVTNRAELMCVDTNGFYDGENDGSVVDEVEAEKQDADIVWSLDMMGDELKVFPHNMANCSPVVFEDYVYIITSNGVDQGHSDIPNPDAPSFLAVNKHTGKIVWQDNSPGTNIKHGQWSSPGIGVVNGHSQVFMPGGDGWLYAFDTLSGELIWKFDLNPKSAIWELGGGGTRNNVISSPVFYDNSVIIATGQDPEHGDGAAYVYRIDATKTGDVSAERGKKGSPGTPNPNSALLWRYGGIDENVAAKRDNSHIIFNRTIATAAVGNGKVYIPDLRGYVHCIDFESGKRIWHYDALSRIWGSAVLVDNKIVVGNEDGELLVLDEMLKEPVIKKDVSHYASIYGTPTIANRKLFIPSRTRLFVFSID